MIQICTEKDVNTEISLWLATSKVVELPPHKRGKKDTRGKGQIIPVMVWFHDFA
jgi:hypothetical protein